MPPTLGGPRSRELRESGMTQPGQDFDLTDSLFGRPYCYPSAGSRAVCEGGGRRGHLKAVPRTWQGLRNCMLNTSGCFHPAVTSLPLNLLLPILTTPILVQCFDKSFADLSVTGNLPFDEIILSKL